MAAAKKKPIKTGASSGHIINLKQSSLETFDVYGMKYIWKLKTSHNCFLKLLNKLFTFPPVWSVIKQTKNLEFRILKHLFYVFIQIFYVLTNIITNLK
jgi:hypothetical protein